MEKNETNKGINCIQRFDKTNNLTNFFLMDVSHRYDLEQITCVNKEVEKYNRRIQKHMKVFENTEVIKVDLDRRDFTKHGQHMNAKGKDLMAKRIAAAIKRTLNVSKKTPISMKWKQDPSKENPGLGEGKMELEKEEIQSKTRMTVSQWKIIIVEGKSQGRKGGENETKTPCAY